MIVTIFYLIATMFVSNLAIVDDNVALVDWRVAVPGGPVTPDPGAGALLHPDCQHEGGPRVGANHGLEAYHQDQHLSNDIEDCYYLYGLRAILFNHLCLGLETF